ncbi:type II toxin-antitoxin system HicB family antitoxin [Burkholderia glumae]|uniref:type II toxin-antitoxin system HicB family antitoxin n=1 Tax=Burkholderia glumae TaxID=337 RepID=UPI0021506DF6|nr:type II toxin-antitoxin system HicB family antitoxin [Burkholderia glumae]
MLYPLYVHVGDDKHAHGVTFPDFPGCHAAADSWDELPAAVQEAAQAHFEGDDSPIPVPSALEDLTRDPEYTGGVWMIFDIDLSKINTKAVRFNVSMSERLLQKIDAKARARKLSRSAFLAIAAEHEMEADA